MHARHLVALAGAAILVLPAAASAQAQTHAGHGTADASPAIVGALLWDIEAAEGKIMGLAEAIPESSYGWRPGPGVRSVGEVFRHIMADNYLIPAMGGAAVPAGIAIDPTDYSTVQAYEARELDKATTIAELSTSFAHLRAALQAVDAAALDARLTVFGMPMTGLQLWVLTATHLHEHLGQGIAYARSNGVVPPWSR